MLLEIRDLTKTYGKGKRANDGITFSVPAGTVYGLLGHNGAGKTTLVNQVIGLLKPTSGVITISGRDVVADPAYARRVCSFQAQAQVPINGLTPRQAIEMVGRLRGGSAADVRARATRLIDALDIGEWEKTDGARLSGGVKRLTSFAMAAVVPGGLVMLDEPTNDVDPVRRRLLWEQVRALGEAGAAVLLVTHNVVEAERSVERLVILDEGRVVQEGTPAQLKQRFADDLRLEIVLEPGTEIPTMPDFVTSCTIVGLHVMARLPAGRAAAALGWMEELKARNCVDEFGLTPASLEDVYVELVGKIAGPNGNGGGQVAKEALDVSAA
jgi:ABC-2 type transport system ATP-binding protein